MRSYFPKYFFSRSERDAIESAICSAESKTSGEIRVHVERDTPEDVLGEAKRIFERLGMTRTKERNGVLILFGIKKQQFALIGDRGIHEKVPVNFWDDITQLMMKKFKDDRFADGLVEGIRLIGEKLQDFFPVQKDNPNELPNHISYGQV
ncbi:MAG: TPM domain-containing protein [Candidatus Omnitrophica bacterium]|nr:TPM domain-containing protein [Candidatus Omnitrophota bacterium]